MADVLADVLYEGRKVGAAYWDAGRRRGVFEYTPEFVLDGVELAPLRMPLRKGPYMSGMRSGILPD